MLWVFFVLTEKSSIKDLAETAKLLRTESVIASRHCDSNLNSLESFRHVFLSFDATAEEVVILMMEQICLVLSLRENVNRCERCCKCY